MSHSTTSPGGDGGNPYTPPESQQDPWSVGDPIIVAVRRENQNDEAYVKALGIANYLYAFLFAGLFVGNASYPILHAMHRIDAPWSIQPHWILFLTLYLVQTILAILAGHGFRRLRRGALRLEAALAACWVTLWFVTSFFHQRAAPTPLGEIFAFLFLYVGLAAPMMNLPDLRHSPVLQPEYKAIVEATAHIPVRPKLPLELKLASSLLLLSAVAAFYFNS